jgi:hypothetical protein
MSKSFGPATAGASARAQARPALRASSRMDTERVGSTPATLGERSPRRDAGSIGGGRGSRFGGQGDRRGRSSRWSWPWRDVGLVMLREGRTSVARGEWFVAWCLPSRKRLASEIDGNRLYLIYPYSSQGGGTGKIGLQESGWRMAFQVATRSGAVRAGLLTVTAWPSFFGRGLGDPLSGPGEDWLRAELHPRGRG